jgi:hypothetical protein
LGEATANGCRLASCKENSTDIWKYQKDLLLLQRRKKLFFIITHRNMEDDWWMSLPVEVRKTLVEKRIEASERMQGSITCEKYGVYMKP